MIYTWLHILRSRRSLFRLIERFVVVTIVSWMLYLFQPNGLGAWWKTSSRRWNPWLVEPGHTLSEQLGRNGLNSDLGRHSKGAPMPISGNAHGDLGGMGSLGVDSGRGCGNGTGGRCLRKLLERRAVTGRLAIRSTAPCLEFGIAMRACPAYGPSRIVVRVLIKWYSKGGV